jgi:hypothetical protein
VLKSKKLASLAVTWSDVGAIFMKFRGPQALKDNRKNDNANQVLRGSGLDLEKELDVFCADSESEPSS